MGFILALLPYLVQLFLIIHCIKTGRSGWLWLLVFLPYVGGLAYLILAVIPDLRDSGKIQRMGDSISSKLNPNKEIEALEKLVKKQETITNMVALADAYADEGLCDKAVELYKKCLTGPYEHDPDIEFKIVKAYFNGDKLDEAKTALKVYKENHQISNAEQSLLEMKINEDYEKLAQIFENTGNFQVGYELAKHYKAEENYHAINEIVDQMKEYRNDYPQVKKGENNTYFIKTKALLK